MFASLPKSIVKPPKMFTIWLLIAVSNTNEVNFLTELTHDLETSVNDHETVDPDMAVFSSLIIKQLNKHAPI